MNPWTLPEVAIAQRELVDRQIQEGWRAIPPPQFKALAQAMSFTKCFGDVFEVGCGSGYNREVLDRVGIKVRSYSGTDINVAAVAIAKERYPESDWFVSDVEGDTADASAVSPIADVVIDGSCLLHVVDWRNHISTVCAHSRRWVILHRIPVGGETKSTTTTGYGQKFAAWNFDSMDVIVEMARHGFGHCRSFAADGHSQTLVFARPRVFVTYADRNYLSRLKALYASLVKHAGPFRLYVLACDDAVDDWGDQRCVFPFRSVDFLAAHPKLKSENLPGPRRSTVEQYWTWGPTFIADVMNRTGGPVTYLDADLFAFSSLEPMFAEIGGAPAAFLGHNFAAAAQGLPGPTRETHEIFGKFNVGAVHFADVAIAERWAEMCRLWCYDRVEQVEISGGPVPQGNRRLRYGDQKFLEDLAAEFPGVCAVTNPAAMVGPWNVHTRSLDVRDGIVHFGGRPLGLFHFSGLRELPDGHSVPTRPEYLLTRRQEAIIYGPYYRALEEAKR